MILRASVFFTFHVPIDPDSSGQVLDLRNGARLRGGTGHHVSRMLYQNWSEFPRMPWEGFPSLDIGWGEQ